MRRVKILTYLKNLAFNADDTSLTHRVMRGGFWIFALRLANRFFSFFSTIILARLLLPGDFGLLGISLLALSVLETFSRTGFDTALIQNKNNVTEYLNTAWTVSVLRGGMLFLLLYAFAPMIAVFFNTPNASGIIRLVALVPLLSGLTNIGMVYLKKELEFNRLFFYDMSGTIVRFIVSIVLTLLLRNVYALVWGVVASYIAQVFMSFIIVKYKPRISISKKAFNELFRFGKWVSWSGILMFIASRGDDMLVSKLMNVTALGIYQMAFTISNLPTTEVTSAIAQLAFPAFSKIQDNAAKLSKAFLSAFQLVAVLSLTFVIFIYAYIPEFVQYFLGEKWSAIIAPTRILVIAGAIRALSALWGSLYTACGKPELLFYKHTLRIIFMFVPVVFTIKYGLVGIAAAVLSGMSAAFVFDFFCIRILKPFINFKFLHILSILSRFLVFQVPMVLSIIITSHFFPQTLSGFILGAGTALLVFIVTALFYLKFSFKKTE